ncbi:MAG: hypothetical protein QME76_12380 [Bacillota bacterium]|nr:hypothetical protein [Bacillota bacterium]
MILVIKEGKVIATHTDDQEYVVDHYPDCDVIKVVDNAVEFPRDKEGRPTGLPEDPRLKGVPYVDLKRQGITKQRLADLETALAALLGGGA